MRVEEASLDGWWASGSIPIRSTRENAKPAWKVVFERSPS